jgi:hypothetical protein
MSGQILTFPASDTRERGLDALPRAAITATQSRLDRAVATMLTNCHHATAKVRADLHMIATIHASDPTRVAIAFAQSNLDEAMDELACLIKGLSLPPTPTSTTGDAP